MFDFLSNQQIVNKPFKKLFNGVNHYIFPAVIAKTGVMNDVLYNSDVLSGTADLWNGVKITLRHPKFNGINTSINNADLSDQFCIGELYNVDFKDDKLRGDIYINEASIKAKNAFYLIEWLNNGKNIDVSTGLEKVKVFDEEGEYNGKKYKYVLNSYKADHVAILPDEKGACSVEDGCGTLMNNDSIDVEKEIIGSVSNNRCKCEINNKMKGYFSMKDKTIEFLSNSELIGICEDDKKAFDSLSNETIDILINKVKQENNSDKFFITTAEKEEFEAFKKDKLKKEEALRNQFKELYNADDFMVNETSIDVIQHLVNQKNTETPIETKKPVDYSARNITNNSNLEEVEFLTNKQQIDNFSNLFKGKK